MSPSVGPTALLRDLEAAAVRGDLTPQAVERLARLHNVPTAAAEGLRTFYFPNNEGHETEVCIGLPCALRGSPDIVRRLEAGGQACGRTSCLGYCADGPVVRRAGRFYTDGPEGASEIRESTREHVEAHVQRFAAYREAGGYSALTRFLSDPDRAAVLGALGQAGLRGMGGAGFSVALKWKAVLASKTEDRVVVVNAHEGEPGTFKDRVLLEREPHRLLEGALIAALTVGSRTVVIALKSEYANARRTLEQALDELEAFVVDEELTSRLPKVELRIVPGPYVTGEETALLEALEGRRGEPRLRPPFPAEFGLEDRPTLVQNVETLSAIPALLAAREEGAAPWAPSKDFCVTGDVRRPGIYRKPLGTTAITLLESDGRSAEESVKAFLPGGLSGGLLPASRLGVALDYDAVRREGAGLGTGAVVAIGRERCILEVLESVSGFFATESCGKCVPCRLGTAELKALMTSLRQGTATEADVDHGAAVARLLQETSICALGQVAGKAFLDGLRHFPGEVRAHARGECPAHVCDDRGRPA